jgi:hypothetical protein
MGIEYVVRDTPGSVRNGAFPEGDPATIYVFFSRDVSLNLSQGEVASYTRVGNDLTVTLTSGQVLVLDGYFEEASTGPKNLFLSEQGELVEVFLGDAQEGLITADYATLDVSGKWSGYDDLVFLDLGRIEPVVAPLAAAPLAGLGLGPLAAAGGAARRWPVPPCWRAATMTTTARTQILIPILTRIPIPIPTRTLIPPRWFCPRLTIPTPRS